MGYDRRLTAIGGARPEEEEEEEGGYMMLPTRVNTSSIAASGKVGDENKPSLSWSGGEQQQPRRRLSSSFPWSPLSSSTNASLESIAKGRERGQGLLNLGVTAVGKVVTTVQAQLDHPTPPLLLPEYWYEARHQHRRAREEEVEEGRRRRRPFAGYHHYHHHQPLLDSLRDRFQIKYLRQQARMIGTSMSKYHHHHHHLTTFEEVDCSDWWSMSRSSVLPPDAVLHQVAGARLLLAKIFR